jgi:3-oxoacyl-[acyl-carrier protein] reductase
MDLGLEGRIALVAGASAGIGFAAAELLAAEGARVVLASRDAGRIEDAAERIRESTGGEAVGVALDVTVPDAGERLTAVAREVFGEPGILVTNAGGPAGGGFESLSEEAFERAIRLSFLSAVNLTRAALPSMKRARWGRIVHVSSAVVFEPNHDLFLSSSVRPALAGFSKSLAREVAPLGITTNLVCPGFIATNRLRELAERRGRAAGTSTEAALETMAATVPAGRLGSPGELAAAIAFLCGEPASYITGTALRVDGGKVAFLL